MHISWNIQYIEHGIPNERCDLNKTACQICPSMWDMSCWCAGILLNICHNNQHFALSNPQKFGKISDLIYLPYKFWNVHLILFYFCRIVNMPVPCGSILFFHCLYLMKYLLQQPIDMRWIRWFDLNMIQALKYTDANCFPWFWISNISPWKICIILLPVFFTECFKTAGVITWVIHWNIFERYW